MNKKVKALVGKTRKQALRFSKILKEGTFVAIDPSCVSRSSVPGYAIFEEGKCIEMGVFDIPWHPDLTKRLRAINTLMREAFPNIDLLVLEEIPKKPLRATAKGITHGMNQASYNSLQRAVGAIMSGTPEGIKTLMIPASLWHYIAKKNNWAIVKEDDEDALLIGMAAINLVETVDE